MVVDIEPSDGGNVEVNGEVFASFPATIKVKEGSLVTIQAVPSPGYTFSGWSGEDTVDDQSNPIKIKAIREFDLTAIFVPESLEYVSDDGSLRVIVPCGTNALQQEGAPLTMIDFTILDNPPSAVGSSIIGHAYMLEPAGTTFGPPVTMIWSYDEGDIPEGVALEGLGIAYYDDSGNLWTPLNSEVDGMTSTICANIDHLSVYAVLAPSASQPTEAGTYSASTGDLNAEGGFTVKESALLAGVPPPSTPPEAESASPTGVGSEVMAPLFAAVFLAIFLPVRMRRRRQR